MYDIKAIKRASPRNSTSCVYVAEQLPSGFALDPSSIKPDQLHLECSTAQYCRTASVARPRSSSDNNRIKRYCSSMCVI